MLPIGAGDPSNRENFIILIQLDEIIKRHKSLVLVHCNLAVGVVTASLKAPLKPRLICIS